MAQWAPLPSHHHLFDISHLQGTDMGNETYQGVVHLILHPETLYFSQLGFPFGRFTQFLFCGYYKWFFLYFLPNDYRWVFTKLTISQCILLDFQNIEIVICKTLSKFSFCSPTITILVTWNNWWQQAPTFHFLTERGNLSCKLNITFMFGWRTLEY